jgi:predicted exporter
MALFLVLGFGMDYVIFVYEMRSQPPAALQAILLSALTSLLSFGLLSLSKIPVVSSFGLTLLVGNMINLMGAFILSHQLASSLQTDQQTE